MAIDLLRETKITLTKLAEREEISPSTPWRWVLKGVRGHKLESVLFGGKRFTTVEAFDRFLTAINAKDEVPNVPTPRQRQRSHERAMEELAEAGI